MKKLVVYFSYTGNTKRIAELIQKNLECDILEIKPVIPYSNDYQKVVDEEQNNSSIDKIIEIEKINVDLNNYDELIIGTPVWWYSMAPAIRTFLKNNDLSRKIIKPYATNAGWLGHTFNDIKKLCPNSQVKDEMNIVFESYSDKLVTSEEEIKNWIENI